MDYMQTHLVMNAEELAFVEHMAVVRNPDHLAWDAKQYPLYPAIATQLTVASIRARGNWMLVNGHWHRKG